MIGSSSAQPIAITKNDAHQPTSRNQIPRTHYGSCAIAMRRYAVVRDTEGSRDGRPAVGRFGRCQACPRVTASRALS